MKAFGRCRNITQSCSPIAGSKPKPITTMTNSTLDLAKLPEGKKRGSKTIYPCPACRNAGDDKKGEHLVIFDSGKFGCIAHEGDSAHRKDIFALVGAAAPKKQKPRIVKAYDYTDEKGNVVHQTLRLEPKSFRQRKPDGKGGWIWKLGDTKTILYNLPEIIAADPKEPVWIVEGEKDADALNNHGHLATTCPMGAGKWREHYNEYLRGRKVIVCPDNDKAGMEHLETVAGHLDGIAAEIKAVNWSELDFTPPPGYDVSEHIAKGAPLDTIIETLTTPAEVLELTQETETGEELPEIHRNATDQKYWMQNTHTQNWHAVNMREMTADLKTAGLSKEEADSAISRGRHENSVDGVLQLAGRSRGLFESSKGKVLVPRAKYKIQPEKGDWDVTKALIRGMFHGKDNNTTQYDVFMSWLARAWRAYTQEQILVAQFLHIAGAAGSYKTYLVEHVLSPLFGQIAELNRHLVSDQQFNADLFKGFLWVADDPQLPRNGQVNHELIKAIAVSSQTCRLEGKNINSENTPALRRGIMLTNTGAEAMKVVPVFEDGMEDKIISLYVHKFRLEVEDYDLPTEGALIEALEKEAPAFAYALEQYDPPAWGDDNHADRYGVPSYKNKHVLAALREMSPAAQNFEIVMKVAWRDYDTNPLPQKVFTSAELLAAGNAALADGVVSFFGWESPHSLGKGVSDLEKVSELIASQGKGTNIKRWVFSRPERSPFCAHEEGEGEPPF